MKELSIGDVTITSIVERDGPWRTPEEMSPAYDPVIGHRHLAELDPDVFDPASGKMVITYQTFVVRTPRHTVLIDTCTGEDKGHPPPIDFPKQPWLDDFRPRPLRFEDITTSSARTCTSTIAAGTRAARWSLGPPPFRRPSTSSTRTSMPTGRAATARRRPRHGNVWTYNCPIVEAGQALLVDDDLPARRYLLAPAADARPLPAHCCVNIHSRGQQAIVTGDLMHHALQVASRVVDDLRLGSGAGRAGAAKVSATEISGTGRYVLPIHFPHPTTGLIEPDGARFRYKFVR